MEETQGELFSEQELSLCETHNVRSFDSLTQSEWSGTDDQSETDHEYESQRPE